MNYVEFTDRYVCEERLFTSVESNIHACIGKSVPVLYDSDDPENARVGSDANPTHAATGQFIVGSVFLLSGIATVLASWDSEKG